MLFFLKRTCILFLYLYYFSYTPVKKYFFATLAGAGVLILASGVYAHFIEFPLLGADIYDKPIYKDMSVNIMQFFIGLIILKLFHSFLLSYLHERIPRCGSGLWEKVWRFTLLAWFLTTVPGLGITYLTMNIELPLILSWAGGNLFQTFFASWVIIPILYHFPAPDTSCNLK